MIRFAVQKLILFHLLLGLVAVSDGQEFNRKPVKPDPIEKLSAGNNFAKENLVAWCIVPFNAQNRGPAETPIFECLFQREFQLPSCGTVRCRIGSTIVERTPQ